MKENGLLKHLRQSVQIFLSILTYEPTFFYFTVTFQKHSYHIIYYTLYLFKEYLFIILFLISLSFVHLILSHLNAHSLSKLHVSNVSPT